MPQFPMTVKEIAEFLGGRLEGDGARRISRPGSLERGGADEIVHARAAADLERIAESRAGAFLIPEDAPPGAAGERPAVRVPNPELAAARLTRLFPREGDPPAGVHERAAVALSAEVDPPARIGPFAAVGERAKVGARTVLRPGAVVGEGATIGADCLVGENAVIGEHVRLGHRVTVGPGSVVGSEGFGNVPTPEGWLHIRHLGTVVVEDDVAIDANVCIDRGRFDETVIERGARIDNLVQIAHNCRVGANSALAAQSGLAGSVRLGEQVLLGGQVGIIGHVTIERESQIGAQSGISKSWPARSALMGTPARQKDDHFRIQAGMSALPRLFARLEELRRRVARLERGK